MKVQESSMMNGGENVKRVFRFSMVLLLCLMAVSLFAFAGPTTEGIATSITAAPVVEVTDLQESIELFTFSVIEAMEQSVPTNYYFASELPSAIMGTFADNRSTGNILGGVAVRLIFPMFPLNGNNLM